VGVANLDRSILFYSTLFGAEPAVVKPDYAKWMLEDPRVNFAISCGQHAEKGSSISASRSRMRRNWRRSTAVSKPPGGPSSKKGKPPAAMPGPRRAGSPIPTAWFGRRS
jgi:hypothetical protein